MNDDYTLITEAQNRHHFEKKEAFGTIGDDKVYLVASLDKYGNPRLSAMVGGDWYHYEDEEEMDDEYVRHTKTEASYERADQLNTAFNALVEKYDLSEELPESWKGGDSE